MWTIATYIPKYHLIINIRIPIYKQHNHINICKSRILFNKMYIAASHIKSNKQIDSKSHITI